MAWAKVVNGFATERYLRDFHRRHPAATSTVLRHGRTPFGDSSYERLAELVPRTTAPLTVVDLACGDGLLLQTLHQRQQPALRLIGLDLSIDELSLARRHLGASADLLLARAQTLPLADATIDVVCCHLGLMIFDPIESALAEIRRVLRPGGLFAAVVAGGNSGSPLYSAFEKELGVSWRRQGGAAILGDPRARHEQGLEQLLGVVAGFGALSLAPLPLQLDETATSLWHGLSRTYGVDRLDDRARDELRAWFLASASLYAGDSGSIPFTMSLIELTCRA